MNMSVIYPHGGDNEIKPGDVWDREIRHAIRESKAAVMLVSSNYLASDYIQSSALPLLLDGEKIKVFWLPLDACNWDASPLRRLQSAVKIGDVPVRELDPDCARQDVGECRAARG